MTEAVKVLVADDEPECIALVQEALRGLPYQVIAVGDGEAALTAARQHSPQLIILDVQMPKRTGFEVFAELRADPALAGVPVIVLTGLAQRTGVKISGADMGEYTGEEPNLYLDKPIEPAVLRQAVKRLLRPDAPKP